MSVSSQAALDHPLDRPSAIGSWFLPAFGLLVLGGLIYVGYALSRDLASAVAVPWILLGLALLIALGFEFVNGFHDTANAVATVIYTNSLPAEIAVVWSGVFNFLGRAHRQRRGRVRHHLAAAGGADPAG